MEIFIILFIVYGMASGAFCAYLANEKGRDGAVWFFLGLFFTVISLLTLIGLPRGTSPHLSAAGASAGEREGGTGQGTDSIRSCPHCMGEVPLSATTCSHCQRDLSVEHCAFAPCGKPLLPSAPQYEDKEGRVYCSTLHRFLD